MASRDTRPAFADDQSAKAHEEPLLGRRSDHDRFDDDVDDLQRAHGEFNESHSHRSSLELIEPPFEQHPSRTRSHWRARLLRYVSLFTRPIERRSNKSAPAASARSSTVRVALCVVAITLMMLGVVQFVSLSSLTLAAIFPDQTAYFVDHFGDPSKSSKGLLHWPTDFSRDIQPVPCHSHNDYWRKAPLLSALQAGCISVEADVWLVEDDLYVGHSTSSLTSNRTFKNLYVNPLLDILAKQNPTTTFHPDRDSPPNGVFDTDSAQTLVLLVDFKTDGHSLWPHVYAQLDPLRQAGFLRSFDGTSVIERPVTVVATGNAPFDLLTSNFTYRDIFFDAPLDRMGSEGAFPNQKSGQGTVGTAPMDGSSYNITNSYYASTSFGASIGSVWSDPSTTQLEHIRAQIQGAHDQGLKARYWETPAWPRGLRNHIWNVLVKEGVDFLNVDDLEAATEGTWGTWS